MPHWPSVKAKELLRALLRKGWVVVRQVGSHRVMRLAGRPDFVFAFHDSDTIGPKMMARVAKHTGLVLEDLG